MSTKADLERECGIERDELPEECRRLEFKDPRDKGPTE